MYNEVIYCSPDVILLYSYMNLYFRKYCIYLYLEVSGLKWS